jgi:pyruvate-ferredoxin/flavodoxin oxidoreductase
MDEFLEMTGREYKIFDYYGHPAAEKIIILMGSGCETVQETVDYLNQQGEKVGVIKVRLYRPFDVQKFIDSLPKTTRSIAVLDRTKEPGAIGEPLYLDVVTALAENQINQIKVVGGRYGLSSKEFTPAMVKAVFDNLDMEIPKNHFTIGINDDVTHTSLGYNPEFNIEADNIVRAIFYGLGADGTVGANKNSIKIIGEETDNYSQGYFVYDSKKSGSVTVSHLRFGSQKIRSHYLITKANFIACHQWDFLEKFPILKEIIPGGTFLLNAPDHQDEIWDKLPASIQQEIINKNLNFYVINAYKVAREAGIGGHINIVMQVCFFAISGILPRAEAIAKIKESIHKTYGKKGEEVVELNIKAVDKTLENLHQIIAKAAKTELSSIPEYIPDFVHDVLGKIIARQGDDLPVSALPIDGTYPTGTSKL